MLWISAKRRWQQSQKLHTITLAEGQIEYAITADDGPVVLYVHGSPGGADHDQFRREGYRTLIPSRPGYMGTPLSMGKTPDEQARCYAQLLNALEIEDVIVVAASGGGPSALAFAASYPERVKAMVLIEVVSQPMALNPMPSIMQSDVSSWCFLRAMGAERLLKMMVPSEENRRRVLASEETLSRFSSLMWGIWPPSVRMEGWLNDQVQFQDFEYGEIHVPTLILHGAQDINVPHEQSIALADHIKGSTLDVIEGADHFMAASHMDVIRDRVDAFFGSL